MRTVALIIVLLSSFLGACDGTTDPEPQVAADQIAFVSLTDGTGELWTMDIEGQDVRKVPTPGVTSIEKSGWSSDGTRIVFDGGMRTGTSWDIFSIRPGGSDLRRPTSDPGAERQPAWRP